MHHHARLRILYLASSLSRADQVVPTSDTSNVFTLMLNHELPVTDVIDPILESQPTRMRDTEVAGTSDNTFTWEFN